MVQRCAGTCIGLKRERKGLGRALQESSLDSPLGDGAIDHQGSNKAEHDGEEVGHGQRPGGSPRSETLLRDLGGIGIANGRGTCRRKGGQTGKEDLGGHVSEKKPSGALAHVKSNVPGESL